MAARRLVSSAHFASFMRIVFRISRPASMAWVLSRLMSRAEISSPVLWLASCEEPELTLIKDLVTVYTVALKEPSRTYRGLTRGG